MALAVGLAGCDCPPMDAMVVRDPQGLASGEQVREIRAAFDDFERWTGAESLCVPGVRIRRLPFVGGRTLWRGAFIQLDPEWLEVAHQATLHELCHAWDREHGFLSLDEPGLFPEDDEAVSHAFVGPVLRRLESFAFACQEGPRDLGFELGLEEACGLELVGPRERFLLEEVFLTFGPSWTYGGEVELELERGAWADNIWDLGSLGGSPFLLVEEAEGADGSRLWLERVDPATGESRAEVMLPGPVEVLHETLLVSGRDGLLLLVETFEGVRAWSYREGEGVVDRAITAFPSLDRWGAGVVRGDTLWASIEHPTFGWIFVEQDLVTGSWRRRRLREGDDELHHLQAVRIQDLGTGLLVHDLHDGERLLRIDPLGGTVETIVQRPLEVGLLAATGLEDGRLLLVLQVDQLALPAVVDPDSGAWWLARGSCDGGWPTEVMGHHRRADYWQTAAFDGGVVVLQEGEGEGRTPSRILIPPR